MRKQLLVLDGVVLAVALLAAVADLLLGTPRTPYRTSCDRVRWGMTPEEVHAHMGEPAVSCWSSTGLRSEIYDGSDVALVSSGSAESAGVLFANGRVTRKTWGGGEPTWLESVCFRLGC